MSHIIGWWLVLLVLPVQAIEGGKDQVKLLGLLNSFNALEGGFEQTGYAADGAELDHSGGIIRALKPAFFYWEINTPDHQIFMSDGKSITHYDVDLEQVVIQENQAMSGQTALAALINGDAEVLNQEFEVEEEAEECFRLLPRQRSVGFSSIRLCFVENVPSRLDLYDDFGQLTRIDFDLNSDSTGLMPESFQFEIPAGVDVIRND